MRSILIVALLSTMNAISPLNASGQSTYHVDDDTCPNEGAGTPASPLCRIQRAIELATSGDEIVVAAGTYSELINFIGKDLIIRSLAGAELTIIDATDVDDPGTGKPVVRCDNGEGPDAVLDGFTITGGTGKNSESGDRRGGGMYCINSDPSIRRCIFVMNTAHMGGGIYANSSRLSLDHCVFRQNTAFPGLNSRGGGMFNFNSTPTITACSFEANRGDSGAGMFNDHSDPTITHCIFDRNIAGDDGGGIYSIGSTVNATNCLFTGNQAPLRGGGLATITGDLTVVNCVFTGNESDKGAALYNDSRVFVQNSSFTRNDGDTIYAMDNVTSILNCILWGNFGGSNTVTVGNGRTIVRYSHIILGGGGNPLFVDVNGEDNLCGTPDDNLRLLPGSPAIDAGFSIGTTLDLDGNRRIVDDPATPDTGVGFPDVIDLGPYEFGSTSEFGLADLDGDGDVDLEDFGLWQVSLTGP